MKSTVLFVSLLATASPDVVCRVSDAAALYVCDVPDSPEAAACLSFADAVDARLAAYYGGDCAPDPDMPDLAAAVVSCAVAAGVKWEFLCPKLLEILLVG
jgi:hypothetical protein